MSNAVLISALAVATGFRSDGGAAVGLLVTGLLVDAAVAAAGAADVAALATGPPKSRPPAPASLKTFAAAEGAADVAALATGPPKSRSPTTALLETFTAAVVTPPVTTPGVATARVVTRRPCTGPGADLPSDRPADSATDAAADACVAPPRPARRTDLAAADRSTDPARPAPALRASDDTEEASLLSAAATPNACGPANDRPTANAAAPTRTPLDRTDIRRSLPPIWTTSKTQLTLQHVRKVRRHHRPRRGPVSC